MKETSAGGRGSLGYLTAFTLGIICMGVIVFVTNQDRWRAPNGAEPEGAGAVNEGDGESQRRRLAAAASRRTPRGATFRPPPSLPANAEVSAAEQTGTMEEAAADLEAHEPARSVNRSVAMVADRLQSQSAARADVNTRVSGRVFLSGKAPAERVLPMDARCAAEHEGRMTTRFYVTGKDHSLADVLVVIAGGLPRQEWPVPQQPVTLRLRGCIYENHVVGVQTDQTLLVENFDSILHNIHNIPAPGSGNPESNRAIMPRARPFEYRFPEAERFLRFKCDVHPWEFAYVNVVEHPFFAVTDANGSFTIPNVPPGSYTIQAHHRKAGIVQREITVEQNRNVTVNFEIKAPAAEPMQI